MIFFLILFCYIIVYFLLVLVRKSQFTIFSPFTSHKVLIKAFDRVECGKIFHILRNRNKYMSYSIKIDYEHGIRDGNIIPFVNKCVHLCTTIIVYTYNYIQIMLLMIYINVHIFCLLIFHLLKVL